MSDSCNCGCSSTKSSSENGLLQIIPRPTATPVIVTTRLSVSGMTCSHCVASVTEELKEIDDIQGLDIILDAKGISTLTVSSSATLDENQIRAAIDEAGYTLEAINA